MDHLARARITAGGTSHPVPGGMLETTENLWAEYRISREEQDELALRSQQRYAAGAREGRFDDELVPVSVSVPVRHGTPPTLIDTDEHPRPDTTPERLAVLRPVRLAADPFHSRRQATPCAANASARAGLALSDLDRIQDAGAGGTDGVAARDSLRCSRRCGERAS